jgi:hypothetical protein
MKRFFFLSTEIFFLIIGSIVFSYSRLDFPYFLLIFIFCFLLLFIFRRSAVSYKETLKNTGEIYLSPIHGTVESVRYSILTQDFPSPCHEVRISVSFWDQKGLYLPTSAELAFIRGYKGKRLQKTSQPHLFYGSLEDVAHTDLTFLSKNNTQTFMRFVDCPAGMRPSIWLKSGDRGRGGACFGYYPFGGTLLIYLPQESDILIFEKEKITPGQTVIALIKD